MIDKKINSKQLANDGLIYKEVEVIPPGTYDEKALAQLRTKRRIPYYRIGHLVYYQVSELVDWIQSKKVEVAV